MTFKNYLKLATANFDKTWKLVFYRLIVWAILIALMAPCFSPLKEIVTSAWDGELFKSFAGAGLFYGANVAPLFLTVFEVLVSALTTLFTSFTLVGVYLAVILFLLRPILMNIGRYVVDEMMYGFMSSHAKLGFSGTLVRTLKKSLPYAFFRTLYCLPFNVLTAAVFYGLLMVEGSAFALAMPFVFIVSATIILAVKQTFILGWAPAMVVYGENVFKSFGIGAAAVLRGFGGAFAFSICIYFAMLIFALGFGAFSLIILVPLYAVISSMFETMNFFACQGMRYYIAKDTVLSSKKLEERDTLSKAKFLL